MIYFTGDTHNDIDIHKVFIFMKMKNYNTKVKNYIIITGDFGIPWFDDMPSKGRRADETLLDKLNTRAVKHNFDILFCDGNHENFNTLYEYPTVQKYGGNTHQLRSNIFHLKRGEIFTIENKTIFAFGGAESVDKDQRILGVSWWKEEQPSIEEYNYGMDNLEKHNNKVDIIVTHTAPKKVIEAIGFSVSEKLNDPVVKYLDHLDSYVKCNRWFFGHFHVDKVIDNKYFAMYKKMRLS